MTKEEIEELKGLASSIGLYDDKNPCKRAIILGKAIKELEKEPSEDCIARQPLIDNWNCCADMLMGECDSEVVMGWIFDAPSVTPTQEPIIDKIKSEITDWQTDIHDNEYDAEKHDFVFERIYEIIDEQRAESEDK